MRNYTRFMTDLWPYDSPKTPFLDNFNRKHFFRTHKLGAYNLKPIIMTHKLWTKTEFQKKLNIIKIFKVVF